MTLTQFISHRLCRWEFKRFYRYREGILNGCKSGRCRRLMNWNNFFFCIFLTICWYTSSEQPLRRLAEANKILANDLSIKWSSKPTDPIKQRSSLSRMKLHLEWRLTIDDWRIVDVASLCLFNYYKSIGFLNSTFVNRHSTFFLL